MQKCSHTPYNPIITQHGNDRFIGFDSDILINCLLPLCSVRGQKRMIMNHCSTFFFRSEHLLYWRSAGSFHNIPIRVKFPLHKMFFFFSNVFTHMATHFMCWHDKDDFFTFTSVLAYKVYGLWSLNLYDLKERGLVKWDFKILFSSGILSSVNHNERFVSLPHKNSTKEQKNNFLQITVVLLSKNPVFPITIHFCCVIHSNFLSC